MVKLVAVAGRPRRRHPHGRAAASENCSAEAQLIYNWEGYADDVAPPCPRPPHPVGGHGRGPPGPGRQAAARPRLDRTDARTPHSTRSTARITTKENTLMPVSVTMPQLGESVAEGTVTRWLKQEGDPSPPTSRCWRYPPTRSTPRSPHPPPACCCGIRRPRGRGRGVGGELAVIGAASEALLHTSAPGPSTPEPNAPEPNAPEPGPLNPARPRAKMPARSAHPILRRHCASPGAQLRTRRCDGDRWRHLGDTSRRSARA